MQIDTDHSSRGHIDPFHMATVEPGRTPFHTLRGVECRFLNWVEPGSSNPSCGGGFDPVTTGFEVLKKWRNVARPGRTIDNRRIPLLSMVGRRDSEAWSEKTPQIAGVEPHPYAEDLNRVACTENGKWACRF